MLDISPQGLGGDAIRRLDFELNKLQREMDGMSRQDIIGVDGNEFEVIGKRKGFYPVDNIPLLPFGLTLLNKGDGKYAVTVEQGYVIERAMASPQDVESLNYHECANRVNGDKLVEFPIKAEEAVFVQVLEDEAGAIKPGADVIIVIGNRYDTKSRNYIPGVEEGKYFFKLAEAEMDGKVLRLVPFATGSHIYVQTGLTADYIIKTCPAYDGLGDLIPSVQKDRLSFIGGTLHSINQSEADRPYAPQKIERETPDCS